MSSSETDVTDKEEVEEDAMNMKEADESEAPQSSSGKAIKPGIVYLSSIPYFMGVRKVRDYFQQFGEVGRMYLQPEVHRSMASGKKEKHFAEGWIEFKNKKIAKRVAISLNNQPVGGKRRSKAAEALWNLRYLSNFKWIHLSEQIAYEKAANQQRLRNEISQAKRTADFFAQGVEKGKHLRRLEEETLKKGGVWEKYQRQIQQRQKLKEKKGTKMDKEVLGMIFAQ